MQPDPVVNQTPASPVVEEEMPVEADPMGLGPDLAYNVYKSIGYDVPGVTVQGFRSSMSDTKSGDLIGWYGGQEMDGRYVGHIAVYAGNREIIEPMEGIVRRRKLASNENTFGIPVNLPDDQIDV